MTLRQVVFPAPFGPISPVNPRPTDSETPSRTTLPPNATWMSSSSTAGVSADAARSPAPSTATSSGTTASRTPPSGTPGAGRPGAEPSGSLGTLHRPLLRPPAGQPAEHPRIAQLLAQRHQPSAQHGDREHQRHPVGDGLVVAEVLEDLDQDHGERGAEDRPQQRAGPADEDHHQERHEPAEVEHRRAE